MIARLILSLLLCSVLVYAWIEYRRSPVVALMTVAAGAGGLYFVWFPSHSTMVAEFVGIGRGADLVLYLWVCISLFVLLNLHLKLRAQHDLITKLARTIAMANTSPPSAKPPRTLSAGRASQKGSRSAGGQHRSGQRHDQIA